jgi:hypothetical protein
MCFRLKRHVSKLEEQQALHGKHAKARRPEDPVKQWLFRVAKQVTNNFNRNIGTFGARTNEH